MLPVKSTSLARGRFDSLGGTSTSMVSFSSGSGEKNSRQTLISEPNHYLATIDFSSNTMKIYYKYVCPTMNGFLIVF